VTKLDMLSAFRFDDEHMFPPYAEIMQRRVATIMTRDVRTVWPRTPLHKVLRMMVEFRCKSFPVVDDGNLVGIVAREDVMRGLVDASRGKQAERPGDPY
jgi:CBS domain-containing protein